MFKRNDGEHGAVSAFLIMIFAAVFAFVAVLIDFSRMNAVRAQSEVSLHAAVRSVLSSYDPGLMKRYGLFAVGTTDSDFIFSKVLQDSFKLGNRHNTLTLLGAKPDLDSSELELSGTLGLYPVFNEQIREQMKYKAPINIALDIFQKLKPAAGVMKEAAGTMDVLSKLQKLYTRREELIDQAFTMQKQATEAVRLLSDSIKQERAGSPGGGGLNGEIGGSIGDIADSAAGYAEYSAKLEADAAKDPLDKQYTAELAAYRSGTSRVFQTSGELYRKAEALAGRLAAEAPSLLEQAQDLNEQMKLVIQQAENRPEGAVYDSVSSGPSAGNPSQGSVGDGREIGGIRAGARSLLREDAFFTEMKQNAGQQQGDFAPVGVRTKALLGLEDEVVGGSISAYQYAGAVAEASQTAAAFVTKYSSIMNSEEQLIMQQHGSDAEIKRDETAAKVKMGEANSLLGKLSALKNGLQEQQENYDLLEQYEQDSLRFNSAAENARPESGQPDNVYDAGAESMKGMDKLYGGLAKFLDQATDDCFQTEYAADYFNAFAVAKLQGLLAGQEVAGQAESSGGLSGEDFAPQQQEMEYILYGFHNPTANVAAAFGEIFAMRLAIRTMEGFIANAGAGNPLLILASALLYGVEHALQDLITLAKTGSIQISKYLDIPLSYKDHLRIFMLLRGANDSRLTRMLALIRLNTSINPAERSTYASGTVKTGIHLLFLPGVAKAMDTVFSRSGEVEGSRYFTVKHAEDFY